MTHQRDILIVEDDPSMCELISMSLRDGGYRVRACTIQTARSLEGVKVDAVVVAINSPKATRGNTIKKLRELFPSSAFVATSGYFPASIQASGGLAAELGVERTLPKPFRVDQLLEIVRDLTKGM
ncbi:MULTISPECIES: response regulator [Paraburkholderia]|uniref:Response regulator n=1 Tax=Paraburkholderia unamae TaxID=219649 RepID=A0ACC6RFQ6_9BURK